MTPIGFLEPFPNPKTYPTATPSPIAMKEVEIANLEGVALPAPLPGQFLIWNSSEHRNNRDTVFLLAKKSLTFLGAKLARQVNSP